MTDDERCQHVQLELSVAHDEARLPTAQAADHLTTCDTCSAFRRNLPRLDALLAAGEVSRAPDVTAAVMTMNLSPRRQWWWVAAVAAIGMLLGALTAGIGRLDAVQAEELDNRFHTASPSVAGLHAELVVVERGWHPDVPERVYVGSLAYAAPEQMTIDLADTTPYPDEAWIPNDVGLGISDGVLVSVASAPCPIDALPACQQPPSITALRDLRPFDDGVLVPLEIVAPAGSFTWWSGLDVIGSPTLDGQPTILVETTVAGADLIEAITDRGAWRELHPTDRVVMWLDEETLVPARVEVFAADSLERDLWQIRRGYADDGEEPIFILALSAVTTEPPEVRFQVPDDARSSGFTDGPTELPEPTLDDGFVRHRTGHWLLPEGGRVEVASWSDGRSWVIVEVTEAWTSSQLFGMSTPFAARVDLGSGSVGYLDPSGGAIAIHADSLDVVVSGSATEETLRDVAASLELTGRPVPDDWAEASVVEADQMPAGTLVPEVEGWSVLGRAVGDRTEILMTGSGSRRVVITSEPGERLDPPIGSDVVAVDVRSSVGRLDAATATLEWVEDGHVIRMRSETVGRGELLDLAAAMVAR